MTKTSRRLLARWAADQLEAGQPLAGIARHLAAALHESKMADQADFLINDIVWELERRQVLTVGKVTSATPLSAQLEKSLVAHLKKISKSESIVLETAIDKSVIGGVRIETSDRVWDQTVSHKLTELREVF